MEPAQPPSDGGRLDRAFRAVIFDWDGTAVASRADDAAPLAAVVEQLLRRGVWMVVVTGTRLDHVERQLCRLISPGRRRRLLVCTNRGSEVYGFDRRGVAACRWHRQSTPAEESALTATADGVRDAIVARTGLEISIAYDRLNRRKIDLIPDPAWADPPKSQIAELILAVESRLCGAGLDGGLAGAIELTRRLAAAHGLPDARITSDVKHVEVGLTDKGDSVAWVREHLLRPGGIPLSEVLIVGDELGSIAGFTGSYDRLRAEAPGAVVVSVGREPHTVPAGVVHLSGGPARFRDLLERQLRRDADCGARPTNHRRRMPSRWVEDALAVPADPGWRLEEHGYHPSLEHEVESRLAIANGLLGVRASTEVLTPMSRPLTLIAGLFDGTQTEPSTPALAPGPNWTCLRLSLDGRPLAIVAGQAPAHPRTLDLRRGALVSEWLLGDGDGHAMRLRALRLASLADRAVAAQVVQIDVDQPGTVTLEAALEPPSPGLEPVGTVTQITLWRMSRSGRHLAIADTAELRVRHHLLRPDVVGTRRCWSWQAEPGNPAMLTRVMAIGRGTDSADAEDACRRASARARRRGLPGLLAAHERTWAERWDQSDVVAQGDDEAQEALRFAVYHLISAANPDDERVSVGARALTGEAYLGHVFWDTEIFLLPFYTLTWPEAARAMLMYRVHTLPAAREKATRLGFRGALYAWESADTGEEATPTFAVGPDGRIVPIRCGAEEHHISADVAYAAWQYWQATRDASFLLDGGAEIVLETARFWASRVALGDDGRYHIRGVIGPDEYHEDVDDNVYTNVMAQWNLERGIEVQALLRSRWPRHWSALAECLGLAPDDVTEWGRIAAGIAVERDPRTGVLEQFAGYFGLEPIDLAAYAGRTAPMDVVLGPECTRASQVIKQADVVMLLALLWDRFSPEQRRAIYRFYEPRCGHGSSLSPAMHALVAARLGDVAAAERYFHQAAAIDLDDTFGHAALGVHIGALGGLWQAATFGFAGLSLRQDGIRLDPHLPRTWQGLRFRVRWRKRSIHVEIRRERQTVAARLELERGRPMAVQLGDVRHTLSRGEAWTCRLSGAARIWKEAADS